MRAGFLCGNAAAQVAVKRLVEKYAPDSQAMLTRYGECIDQVLLRIGDFCRRGQENALATVILAKNCMLQNRAN